MTTIARPAILRATAYQLAVLLLIVAMFSVVDRTLAVSAIAGGLVQISPQAWFSWQAFKYAGARQVDLVIKSMYRGEAGKVVLTAVLFAILFTVNKQWNYPVFFTTFLLMIPLQWFLTKKALEH